MVERIKLTGFSGFQLIRERYQAQHGRTAAQCYTPLDPLAVLVLLAPTSVSPQARVPRSRCYS